MANPVTLDDAKVQLRIELDDASRDDEIEGYIDDAADWVERYTGHILEARGVEERFDSFQRLELRAWPIKADAVVGIGYKPRDATPTNLYGARLSAGRPAVVLPQGGTRWPTNAEGVIVLVRAGYEPGDLVPGNIRRAMLVLIAGYEADREGGEVFRAAEAAAKSLCRDYRLKRL